VQGAGVREGDGGAGCEVWGAGCGVRVCGVQGAGCGRVAGGGEGSGGERVRGVRGEGVLCGVPREVKWHAPSRGGGGR
jgi:hypothetical protein